MHAYVRTYVRTYTRTHVHTYIHTYIRTYSHIHTHIYKIYTCTYCLFTYVYTDSIHIHAESLSQMLLHIPYRLHLLSPDVGLGPEVRNNFFAHAAPRHPSSVTMRGAQRALREKGARFGEELPPLRRWSEGGYPMRVPTQKPR